MNIQDTEQLIKNEDWSMEINQPLNEALQKLIQSVSGSLLAAMVSSDGFILAEAEKTTSSDFSEEIEFANSDLSKLRDSTSKDGAIYSPSIDDCRLLAALCPYLCKDLVTFKREKEKKKSSENLVKSKNNFNFDALEAFTVTCRNAIEVSILFDDCKILCRRMEEKINLIPLDPGKTSFPDSTTIDFEPGKDHGVWIVLVLDAHGHFGHGRHELQRLENQFLNYYAARK